MFSEIKKYKQNGHFFFTQAVSLREASEDVPELPGVYYIVRLAKGHVDLVYIGKSGTIEQNGRFKNQLLHSRLNNKQNGMKREEFFLKKMREENIDGLDIYWFVTFDKENQDLPGYVEGLLMQRYFEVHRKLPPWNGEF